MPKGIYKRKPLTEIQKDRLRNLKKGLVSNRKGVKLSQETKEKLRLAHLGKPHILTPEGKKSFSEKMSGRNNPSWKEVHIMKPDIRYSILKKNGGYHTKEEWEEMKKKYGFTCPSCLKKEPEIKLTIDHIIPISKSGTNNIDNIQPLCIKCNSSKKIDL